MHKGVMGAGSVCLQLPGRNLEVRVGWEEEGTSSLRPELAAIARTLQAMPLETDLMCFFFFNPGPVWRVPIPNRYTAKAQLCFCKNNKRRIIIGMEIARKFTAVDTWGLTLLVLRACARAAACCRAESRCLLTWCRTYLQDLNNKRSWKLTTS